MNRSIRISTDVFAAIWANRKDGESTEDSILRRLLNCPREASSIPAITSGGVYDSRNNVRFDEGFEAVRSYKGQEFKAIATNGNWLRQDTGEQFATLNQLNTTITDGNENIWNGNWKYRSNNGKLISINTLRT
jgi:hypothetical protein